MNIDIINMHVTKSRPANFLFIGRDSHNIFHHYGNPFTHLVGHTQATVKVATREESVQAFEDWLRGVKWRDVEPERRQWILDRIQTIAATGEDLTLGCFCRPKDGFKNDRTCHGQVIGKLILEAREKITAF